MEEVLNLITQKLETMVKPTNWWLIYSKRKAIITLFPYVVYLGKTGKQQMVDMTLRVAIALNSEGLIWSRAKLLIMRLSNTKSSLSLDWLITLASPCVSWCDEPFDGSMVTMWAEAASALPYTEDIGKSVVDVLLHIVSVNSLQPHIPITIWTWLKKQPSLPPKCTGRSRGSSGDAVLQIRALGDIEILKSYLLLIWSEWDHIGNQESGGLTEMKVLIWEDFGGIAMWHDRQDLIKQLDYVLGQLDRGLDYFQQHKPSLDTHHISQAKTQYSELKMVLLEVDGEATNTLARKPLNLIIFSLLTLTNMYRIPLNFHVCSASTMSIVRHFGHLESLPQINDLICILAFILLPYSLHPPYHLPASTFPDMCTPLEFSYRK